MLQGWSLVLCWEQPFFHAVFPSGALTLLWEVWQTVPQCWEGLKSTTNPFLPTDWMWIYTEIGTMQNEFVVRAKVAQTEAPLTWTWHPPHQEPAECGLTHPKQLQSTHPWDLMGFSLIAPKEEIATAHSWRERKTKSNLGPSWVDEIPATFIIQRSYSPGDSWVWSTLISFPPRWALCLDGPGEAIYTGEGGEGKPGWLLVFMQEQSENQNCSGSFLKLEVTQLNNWNPENCQSCFSVIGSKGCSSVQENIGGHHWMKVSPDG